MKSKIQFMALWASVLLYAGCGMGENASNQQNSTTQESSTTQEETKTSSHNPLIQKSKDGIYSLNLQKLKSQNELPTSEPIEIQYDPAYQKTKKYEAIALRSILDKFVPEYKDMNAKGTQVVFECTDGYSSAIGLDKILEKDVFIALKDLNTPDGKWEGFKGHGGQLLSPEPFYVVWKNPDAKDERTYPWAYNLTQIHIEPVEILYGKAFPTDSKEHQEGFMIFKKNCMSCHAVNHSGGTIGPELNIPKNVTEYWQVKELKGFIQNPQNYRYNSKMPSSLHLSDKDIDKLIGYLTYMSKHKDLTSIQKTH